MSFLGIRIYSEMLAILFLGDTAVKHSELIHLQAQGLILNNLNVVITAQIVKLIQKLCIDYTLKKSQSRNYYVFLNLFFN